MASTHLNGPVYEPFSPLQKFLAFIVAPNRMAACLLLIIISFYLINCMYFNIVVLHIFNKASQHCVVSDPFGGGNPSRLLTA